MKAIAVKPGKKNSVHLVEMDDPKLSEIADGRGVLVKVLRVGVDGTDREINDALYGKAPEGFDFLVIGHEGFGVVEKVGKNVTELKEGDYVVSTVRRPGESIYDVIGTSDMTTDDTYFERGISLLHGFLSEYYVEDAQFVVKVPKGLKEVGVLLEPTSIVKKGIVQAFEIQRRLKVWKPKTAAVLGDGTIGILATLLLRLQGIEVVTFGLEEEPYFNADLLRKIGAEYESSKVLPVADSFEKYGKYDIIFEATGYSPIIFGAMQALAKNGVLILSSVTHGDTKVEAPIDKINLNFVLGNKVMVGTVNGNRDYFDTGVKDLSQAELEYPGWLKKMLTHPVKGLENYEELFEKMENGKDTIKVYCEVNHF